MSQHVIVDYCGEQYKVDRGRSLLIGRDADVSIDENPFLHRRFLQIADEGELWWLSNVGTHLTATVADELGVMQAWLGPGGRLPLVFARTVVWFSAGPTTYELDVVTDEPAFHPVMVEPSDNGTTTVGRVSLTPDQRLLIVALSEPVLRREGRGSASVPSSVEAAKRLGWTLTKFNRKLDNVCQKFARDGVRGLHGGPTHLAGNRRAKLVEHALSSRIVEPSDLRLLSDRQ